MMHQPTPSPKKEGCFLIKSKKRAFLFVNGDMLAPDLISKAIQEEDILIAVDGGLIHIDHLNLQPDLIIGDLDSAPPDLLNKYQSLNTPVKKYPVNKNETDLELAIQAATAIGASVIRLVGALGGRLDQTLANIFLLMQEALAKMDVRIIDGKQEIFIIRNQAIIQGQEGQRLSLLPLNGPAEGITTRGLAFPLQDETLFPDKTRGISNQLTASEAEITLKSGILLCIHEIN